MRSATSGCALFLDVFGLEISEGALANLFRRVQSRLGDTLVGDSRAGAGAPGGEVGRDRGARAGTQGLLC